jgi:tRNA-Thr(GGU) m(6)t(6)A37 methyltransferase TsaA
MYSLEPIATVHSCYTQRFGIPRQAGLVTSAQATITFTNNTHNALSLRGLDAFSHIWVIFIFHKDHYDKPKPLVQPPRLGGKKSIGVYATRSPNRLNALGLSCVQLDSIARTDKDIDLHIIGGDFLDGTPVVDIKPYLPFADSIETASCGWAAPPTDTLAVQWHDTAAAALQALCVQGQPDYETARRVIEDTVAQDPRPAHERNRDGRPDQQWHMQIYHCDISFEV